MRLVNGWMLKERNVCQQLYKVGNNFLLWSRAGLMGCSGRQRSATGQRSIFLVKLGLMSGQVTSALSTLQLSRRRHFLSVVSANNNQQSELNFIRMAALSTSAPFIRLCHRIAMKQSRSLDSSEAAGEEEEEGGGRGGGIVLFGGSRQLLIGW